MTRSSKAEESQRLHVWIPLVFHEEMGSYIYHPGDRRLKATDYRNSDPRPCVGGLMISTAKRRADGGSRKSYFVIPNMDVFIQKL